MAITTGPKVTNHTTSLVKAPSAYDLSEKTNYAISDVGNGKQLTVRMQNRTQNSLMYGEQIDRWFKDSDALINSPLAKFTNAQVPGFVSWGTQVDTMYITDDDANPLTGEIRDIVQTIVIQKWTKSPFITPTELADSLATALGQCYDQTTGASRLSDFMHGCINPRDNSAA